jgi:hypothetical protein
LPIRWDLHFGRSGNDRVTMRSSRKHVVAEAKKPVNEEGLDALTT